MYIRRWEVESLFRELKARHALDELNTRKKHIVEILVYAALLMLLVSRELLDVVSEHAADEAVFSSERWATTFRSHTRLILHELSQHLGYTPPPLIDRMAERAQRIHQERPILQERLATATQQEMAN